MDKFLNIIKNFLINLIKKIPKEIYLISLLLISILLLLLLLGEIFTTITCTNNTIKYAANISDKNKEDTFDLNKIICFSSAFSKSSLNSNSTLVLDNVYQYTDIALYINNTVSNFNNRNTIKSLWIDNINFSQNGKFGTQSLYFLPLTDFATEKYSDSNIISDKLDFNITSDNNIDLSTKTLYNTCANPITLKFINNNLKVNFGTDVASLQLDGSLLKKCGILLSSLKTHLSFNINIINNLDEEFKYTFSLDIPLESASSSIYDGSLIYKDETSHPFYRYK